MTSTDRFRLSPQRRALLENLLRAEGIERPTAPAVVPREDRAAPVPLAFPQNRFWFLDRFSANGASYVISAGMRVRGRFRPDVFARACEQIARRHEALRTVFSEEDGQAVQRVLDELPPEVRTTDLRGLPAHEALEEVRRREARLVARPFDLLTGPLFRAELLNLAADETVVLVNVHHIVSDRWSMDLLMRELMQVYRALELGRPAGLPELTLQYPDFALWQNRPSAQETWDADLEYWTRKLKGIPSETGLPTPLRRPREKTYRGSSVPVELPPDLVRRLNELAKSEGATLFMALTAAFKVLLHRLGGDDDVVVGTPVANRTRVELEPLVGLFVNTLALRTDLSGDPDFREVVRRVNTVCVEAYDHQDLPFERLVEQLQPERSLAHTPVFQVLVSYQSVSIPSWDGPLRVEPFPLQARKAEFDLLLDMFQDGDAVWGRLEYSTDLFEEPDARRLARLFTGLLREVVRCPGVPVGRLALLGRAEWRRVVVENNATGREWPGRGLVHECFEE
ncbi:MAG TPA: condensation domain-containing protein, partial [Streptomyces sp.]|uniref:condensation domain-containing protein n=1 Tax=Streptomyces sp. TaxID=1931 RepID=UPI002D4E4ADD